MTPIQIGDYIFVGGPDNQNLLRSKRQPGKAEAVEIVFGRTSREREDGLSPVRPCSRSPTGNMIYGINGDGRMNAIEIPSGERLWESDVLLKKGVQSFRGTAFLVKNGDRFVLFNELGEIVLCKLARAGYEEIDRAKVIEPTNRAFGRRVVVHAGVRRTAAAMSATTRNENCVDLASDRPSYHLPSDLVLVIAIWDRRGMAAAAVAVSLAGFAG